MGKCCNTQKLAAQQKYSDAENFVFHCMINGYENETLEVCAPQQLIAGILIDLHFVKYVEYVEILNLKYCSWLEMIIKLFLYFLSGLCAEFNIAGGSYSNSFYSSMWQRKISELLWNI